MTHNREVTNRRLSCDDTVRLRDVTSSHAYMGTCQSRAKVDDVGEGDLQASRKQQDSSLVITVLPTVFSRRFRYFWFCFVLVSVCFFGLILIKYQSTSWLMFFIWIEARIFFSTMANELAVNETTSMTRYE